MRLSQRVQELKSSPTIALNWQVQQLVREGHDIVNLTVGEPDFPTPSAVVEQAKTSLTRHRTKYGAAGGGPALRGAIAAKLQRENQLSFRPEQIVVGCGAKEILCHLFLSLLDPGDEVLLPVPYWVSYVDQIKLAGGEVCPLPLTLKGGERPRLEPALLERHATPRTVGLVLCSPNNPAGYVLDKGALSELAAYLKTKNWWIISDEIYEYFTYHRRHHSLLEVCPELGERFVVVNGLSKSFAMTGWRVGYAAGPEALINTVKTLQSHTSTCLPPFIEDAAEVAMKAGRSLVSAECEEMQEKRQLAWELAQEVKEIDWLPTDGAFYLFGDIRQFLAKHPKYANLDSLAFCSSLLEQQKLALVPGEAFGTPGFVRISYACARDTLREGFRRLAAFLSKAP